MNQSILDFSDKESSNFSVVDVANNNIIGNKKPDLSFNESLSCNKIEKSPIFTLSRVTINIEKYNLIT